MMTQFPRYFRPTGWLLMLCVSLAVNFISAGQATAQGSPNTVICAQKSDLIEGLEKVSGMGRSETAFVYNRWMPINSSCESLSFQQKELAKYHGIHSTRIGFHFPIYKLKHPISGKPVFRAAFDYSDSDWKVVQKDGTDWLTARSCEVFDRFSGIRKLLGRNLPWYLNIPMHCPDNSFVNAWLITEHLYSGDIAQLTHARVADVYVQEFTRELDAIKVKVLDPEGFASQLPDRITLGWSQRLKMRFVGRLITLETSELADLAQQLRTLPPANNQSQPAATDPASAMAARFEQLGMQSGANSVLAGLELDAEVAKLFAEVEKHPFKANLSAAFMEHAIEAKGLLRFPNRIIRKKLISEIQAAKS